MRTLGKVLCFVLQKVVLNFKVILSSYMFQTVSSCRICVNVCARVRFPPLSGSDRFGCDNFSICKEKRRQGYGNFIPFFFLLRRRAKKCEIGP